MGKLSTPCGDFSDICVDADSCRACGWSEGAHVGAAAVRVQRQSDRNFVEMVEALVADAHEARLNLNYIMLAPWLGNIVYDIFLNRLAPTDVFVTSRKRWRNAFGLPPL